MAKITVELQGLKELQAQINALSPKLKKEIDHEMGDAAGEMKALAQKEAPGDEGILRGGITFGKSGELQWTVYSNALHSVYIEFGTRSKAQVPPGLKVEDVVKKEHSSLGAKQAIFNWCKRNGIEQKFWYPIFIKIMTVGISPRPFFFKQQDVIRPRLIANIQSVLNEQRLQ